MTTEGTIEFSVSWRQPMPPAPGRMRARVLDRLVEMIDTLGSHRLRVAIDGFTAAGKTRLVRAIDTSVAPAAKASTSGTDALRLSRR